MRMSLTFAALAALAAVATACSGGGANGPELTEPTAPQEVVAEATPSPEPPGPPTVVLDPGHGGPEVGAANYGVVEKESNLDMALRVERLLQAAGIEVVLTRREDVRANGEPAGDGLPLGSTRRDLQTRIDLANEVDADLYISIHSNGSEDGSQRGLEVYYDPNREFAEANQRLAARAQAAILSSLASAGFGALDRGIKTSDCIRVRDGRCFPLFVLGPPRVITRQQLLERGIDPSSLGFPEGVESVASRPTEMPGILVELLFISNPNDAAILSDERARDAMASGIASAVLETLGATVAVEP
jgi:N-acetylmuramoyl-L-alanine amidase